jgi:hypothetical protein
MAAEIEVVAAAVTGALTGGVVKPLLAPADALAEYWKDRIRSRLEKVGNAVERKRGTRVLVNERTAYRVLTEAAFTEDEVVREYLAGVAATSDFRDDGAPALAQIARLSAFQLRLHYVIYRELWRQVKSGDVTPTDDGAWRWWRPVFLPARDLVAVFEMPYEELRPAINAAGRWLMREQLVSDSHTAACLALDAGELIAIRSDRSTSYRQPPDPGVVATSSPYGVELFLWGCGSASRDADDLITVAEHQVELVPPVPSIDGLLIHQMPKADPSPRG